MWRWGLSPAKGPADTPPRSYRPAPRHRPHPHPGHPHLPFWIPAFAGMTRRVAGVYFRTDRPCRRAPAHQGMKMRPGRWRCLGVVGATLPLWIPASARMTNSVAADNYFHSNRACRRVPAHEGMKIGCIGWWESSSVIATTHTSPLDSGLRRNDELGGRWRTRKPFERIFVLIAHAGWNRHAQGMKSWSCGLARRIGTADSATPLLRPSGGQAPALHFLIPPSTIGLLKCVAQTARTRWAEDKPPRYINESCQPSGS